MFERVFCSHIIIVIHKIILTAVVRRIDIDNIDTAFVGLFKQTEGVQIITFEDKIIDPTCGGG
ncbi:MAG: hypothetical protein Q4D54_11155, partial [Eubacteriales bacterium]|nr:hypothetical protein [Eubacteriales bacterium]